MPSSTPSDKGSKSPRKKKVLLIGGITLVIIVLAGLAAFFYWRYNDLKANPESIAQDTTNRLVDKVEKLYAVPDEEPTVAQISDKEKLSDQPFFQNAENGDYLLIFTNAKLAVLYRENDNRLINVGPIAITPENQEGTEPAE
ncbi:MAG TPA: hypothetical protein VFT58_05230 [Nitrososphaera sp.]|nr:hypothetical protein [Nitrososphaera sp.]